MASVAAPPTSLSLTARAATRAATAAAAARCTGKASLRRASRRGLWHSASSARGTWAMATMAKKSLEDLTEANLERKRVFVRADLNVPLDENQNITADIRIWAAVPTIQYLLSKGAKVILSSHLKLFDEMPQ